MQSESMGATFNDMKLNNPFSKYCSGDVIASRIVLESNKGSVCLFSGSLYSLSSFFNNATCVVDLLSYSSYLLKCVPCLLLPFRSRLVSGLGCEI